MQVDAFTMQVDAFTMQADAFTMQADAFTMQADAFTMQADAFTIFTFYLNLPNLKLYLTDRFLVTMGTLNVYYIGRYIYDYPRYKPPFAPSNH